MFGIGIGIMVFGYWRLFKWNRERRQDSFRVVIRMNVLGYRQQSGRGSRQCVCVCVLCTADGYRLKSWKPG